MQWPQVWGLFDVETLQQTEGGGRFQPVCERSPQLSLELYQINIRSEQVFTCAPTQQQALHLGETQAAWTFFLQQVKKQKSPRCDFLWCN